MLKNAKEIWDSLIVTHQGNVQVTENKIELLVAQYEQFVISDDEKIDIAYSRFSNICSSLKALGTIYTNKQYVRKFLRALPSKWRPKVTAIDESKDLEKLSLDELIGNLKVHEVILDKDEEADKVKKEKNKSIALKAKVSEEGEYKEDEDDILNDDEQLAFIVRSFKKFYRRLGNHVRTPMDSKKAPFDSKKKFVRKCFGFGDPNQLISECPQRKNEKAFLRGAWDGEENETQEEGKETCLMAIDAPSSERDDEAYLVGKIDNEVLPDSFEFNFDNFVKLCDLCSRVSTSNINLKEEINSLKLEVSRLKERIANSHECLTCDDLKHENRTLNKTVKLLENKIKFSIFNKSEKLLEDILSVQRPSDNKHGLGFKKSTLKIKPSKQQPIVFLKSQENQNVTGSVRSKHGPTVKPIAGPFSKTRPPKRVESKGNFLENKTNHSRNSRKKIVETRAQPKGNYNAKVVKDGLE
ncbi:uncharacterized protein [Rutidosis leptorrhynchoides]|uniref:uncharacterized protein n=1 Tax=Rutidosis leptorrhynchoides TaxID=125765 RepID=UPI003A9904CF